jgi:RND family efflux transporter MFP subunit
MTQTDGIYKSVLRLALTGAATAAVLAISVGLVAGGRSALASRATHATPPPAVAPQAVRVSRFLLEDGYSVDRAFTGQIEPAQRVAAGFEFGGTIAAVFVEEGDAVDAGAPLARLDTRLLDAERDGLLAARTAAQAQAELAARTTERQTALQARGVASSQALDAASLGAAELTARIAEIDASLGAVAIRLEKATLTAPFAGTIAARHLDLGASVEPGRPVLTLVERAAPLFRVGLPSAAVAAIPSDGVVTIRAEGRDFVGRLRTVLPELDGATRTQTALFEVVGDPLPAWRSVGALILTDRVTARGAWAPLSALEAGPRGLWRVLTVDERDGETVAGVEAVEILHATAERAFVRGTVADGARIIADGVHRIVPGQPVKVVEPDA